MSSLALRILASLTVVLAAAGVAAFAVAWVLPRPGQPAFGVQVDGERIPEDSSLQAFLAAKASRLESRKVRFILIDPANPEDLPLGELGLRVDIQTLERRVLSVAHQGSVEQRLDEALRARAGHFNIPIVWRMEPDRLIRALIDVKEQLDEPGLPARFDFKTQSVVPHKEGRYLDVHATLEVVRSIGVKGDSEVKAIRSVVPPVASVEFLRGLDISQTVGHFETRFGYLGGQANRAHNIGTATARLDGVVLLPEQILSFNRIVGHRTLDNGFKKGWEIFKGEMVEGVGGGTCQVASTLHAATYLSGLDVIERSPHSRPSGYIALGLDATVVDGLVDLKIRNPFPFPVVIRTLVEKGRVSFDLLGEQRPARVTFQGDVLKTSRYKRKVTETSWLQEGKIVRKQKGIQGYTVRRTRLIRFLDGRERKEITTDIYPATTEIYLVPPGTDPEADLPPLPYEKPKDESEDGEERDEGSLTSCGDECPGGPEIVDAPGARASRPHAVPRRVVIDR